ncbi:hypothetical protein CEXT_22471, partial [Caerostris extrusa]
GEKLQAISILKSIDDLPELLSLTVLVAFSQVCDST